MSDPKPSHTMHTLAKVQAYYGVTEDVLEKQGVEILSKMLDAAYDDDIDTLHQLGYHIFSSNSVC